MRWCMLAPLWRGLLADKQSFGGKMKERELGDDLPSLRASRDEGFDPVASQPRRGGATAGLRADPPSAPPARGTGPLWALCAALTLALLALGYWTYQQQSMLKQQLVATQTSFARISEEASGRIQDITGKVSATESSLSEAEQARNARVAKLEAQLAQLQKTLGEHGGRLGQHEQSLSSASAGSADLGQRLQAQQAELATLTAASASAEQRLAQQAERMAALVEQSQAASTQLTELKGQLATLEQLEQQLTAQSTQLASQKQALQALQEKGSGDVEQSLLIMRTELDRRAAATEQALDAIDSFRLQTNRSISTLQNQVANLHAQLQGN